MQDEATISFLKDRGSRAKFVTSVCTGSLLLGAAGLLEGYRATSHWTMKALLPIFDAIPTEGRVVRDRNRSASVARRYSSACLWWGNFLNALWSSFSCSPNMRRSRRTTPVRRNGPLRK